MDFIIIAIISVGVGVAIGYVLKRFLLEEKMQEAKKQAEQILENAHKEAQAQKKEHLLQAQDEIYNQKKDMENEFKERENAIKKQENRLQKKEERLESKQERSSQKESELVDWEKKLSKLERELDEKNQKIEDIKSEQEKKLQEISGLTVEEAKEHLLSDIESKTRHEAAKMIRQIEVEARENADRKAKEILAHAIQRYAGDYISEQTVTAMELPSEEMKGRIIGREGRNIRSLEAATGV
ncbi:MAG TPA: Rnase Y domain-containing protein, partial [Desulfohalobiaceae bacterium]|nr:Rnase Y domain-containing protein [Desulfohalobiaceae bacterium]